MQPCEPCTPDEDAEFAAISAWCKAHGRIYKVVSIDTARRKPKDVKVFIVNKRTNAIVAWA